MIREYLCCNRPSLQAETRLIRCPNFRRSYLVKREAHDGKNVSVPEIFVCEIRDTLHEMRDSMRFRDELS